MCCYAFRLLFLYTCLIIIKVGWGEKRTLPNGDRLYCSGMEEPPLKLSDCEAAIRMIPGPPQVHFSPSEDITKPINLELDQDGGRAFRLPAVFVADTCIVSVTSISPLPPQLVPPPPQQAATFMSFVYWPKAKEAAGVILNLCLHEENKICGHLLTKSLWNGWEYHYSIWMEARESAQWMDRKEAGYNIYHRKEVPLVGAAAAHEKSRHSQ